MKPSIGRRRFTRFAALSFATVALVDSMSGCSEKSDLVWVKDLGDGAFVQIPASWVKFRVDPYKVDTQRPTPIKRTSQNWRTVFDSRPKATETRARQDLEADLPTKLVGTLSVLPLTLPPNYGADGFREKISIENMRTWAMSEIGAAPSPDPSSADSAVLAENTGTNDSTLFNSGLDPQAEFENGNPSVELVSYEEYPNMKKFQGSSTFRGLHIRFNYEVYDNEWLTVDQKIIIDPSTSKAYRLVLHCESSCFKREKRVADSIVNSFTIKH